MACSLIGHHAEVQYFCKSSSQLGTALGQGYKCSLDESGHGRMALNSWSKDKGVFCHPPSSIFSSNGSCLGALEEQYGIANIDGRAITNLRFADGVDALAGG